MHLSPEGRVELEARLGVESVARMYRVTRKVRGPSAGRVVIIHGIMGGKLASVDVSGDSDLIWMHVLRLIAGRIEEFRLDEKGEPANPSLRIVTRGLLDEYMPLVLEVGQMWDVLPVAFDWRLDIDKSAAVLNAEIVRWSKGQPVHIVAHSMGGLVSRRFIQLFPQTWAAMKDPDGLRRGGRLVMLGTPNHGSFAIPFVLTGEEKTVRKLERFDPRHNMRELLEIINTFPGSYQMLPSPKMDFGDDRLKLFEQPTWGQFPIPQRYLDLGRRFQDALHSVDSADRLVYVAGFDQPTPYRVRVDGPGQFSYQETLDGDGRVPHELGLLAGVQTYYVREVHGDLPANSRVLAGIHSLLATGQTDQLDSVKPVSRALPPSRAWRTATEIAPIPSAIPEPSRALEALSKQQLAAIEADLLEPFVGSAHGGAGAGTAKGTAQEVSASSTPQPERSRKGPDVTIEVVWGDITQVDGDIFAAGHYEGVEPQVGELALDRAISGVSPDDKVNPDQLVITSQTRRGILRGAVGDINFFPWSGTGKTVAIAGMGHPGTFGVQSLQRTARSLAESVGALPGAKTVNILLIGSGNGNLRLPVAVDALLDGLRDAMLAGIPNSSIRTIRIVEWDLRLAQLIAMTLAASKSARAAELPGIQIIDAVTEGPGGRIGDDIALSAVLLAAARRLRGCDQAAASRAVAQVLLGITATPMLSQRCQEVLGKLGEGDGDILTEAGALNFGRLRETGADGNVAPTRVSFIRDKAGLRSAAISDTAVVPERIIPLDWTLVEDIITRMTNPDDPASIPDLSGLMARLFVPRDFREAFGKSGSLILEVDRDSARIQWEMVDSLREATTSQPLALDRPVARQLRTSYSPTPSRPLSSGTQLRALVIGDPGNPEQGFQLEGARREALEVAQLLRSRGVYVDLLVGAPSKTRPSELDGIAPATVLEMLRLLDKNTYDILHYAGHGDFDPDDPEMRAGWLFGQRLFTARELSSVARVPALVVANACLTAVTSNSRITATSGANSYLRGGDDDLLPGLVDEFFRRGVRNYVGTAWPVSDVGAILFCTTLYSHLLAGNGAGAPESLGNALWQARRALKERESSFGALWAAYQHYGDPSFVLHREESTHEQDPAVPHKAKEATGKRPRAASKSIT